MDNVNAYTMNEDGTYSIKQANGSPPFNIHKEFYRVKREIVMEANLF
jgi:polyphosphate kinase